MTGCPQADDRRIGDGVPDGVTRPDWDECGGRVGDEDKTYRVYTWSPCLETLTCSKPSEIIGNSKFVLNLLKSLVTLIAE